MILDLYESWRASETGRNPGEKAKALLMKEFGFKTKEALDKYLQRARRTRDVTGRSLHGSFSGLTYQQGFVRVAAILFVSFSFLIKVNP